MLPSAPRPGPKLWDLELLGGGPGGGGGSGTDDPQFPCCGEGEYSIGVLASVAAPRNPAEAARREAGGRIGDSGLHVRSGTAFGGYLIDVSLYWGLRCGQHTAEIFAVEVVPETQGYAI